MQPNPFDDDTGKFVVLVNNEEQHSLWPVFTDVPAGWRVAYGEAERAACLDFIDQNWPDIRPKSLRERLSAPGLRCIDRLGMKESERFWGGLSGTQ